MTNIADIRKDYKLQSLSEEDVSTNPFVQFQKWWDDAIASNIDEVNAMALATVNKDGKPSARIVLLKGMNETGFNFYTNYESHKAKDMEANPHVALILFWKELERQIRIEGVVSKLSAEESDEYFSSRPEGTKIGAWSSPQSSVIKNREILEENVIAIKEKFENLAIDRPPFWGGYIVKPSLIEFWQGRSSRLHDRIEYSLQNGQWMLNRLAP
jgi:pyridoxamine 5'-phosphate oxidase